MAICRFCEGEMKEVVGCKIGIFNYVDKPLVPRIPFGSESDNDWSVTKDSICHDCRVKFGHFHHPGCDVERCPLCHNQVISCNCSLI